MDLKGSHARVAVTCVHELLLHLPVTDHVIERMCDVAMNVGFDAHPALGIRHYLRILQDDYVKPSTSSPLRIDHRLLLMIHHLEGQLATLAKNDEAVNVMKSVYVRLVMQCLYKLLLKDQLQPAQHVPWHKRPFMKDAVRELEDSIRKEEGAENEASGEQDGQAEGALAHSLVNHDALVQKRDELIATWDNWMASRRDQKYCVNSLEERYQKEVVASAVLHLADGIERMLQPPFLKTLLQAHIAEYNAYKENPLQQQRHPPLAHQMQQQQPRYSARRQQQQPQHSTQHQQRQRTPRLGNESEEEQQASSEDLAAHPSSEPPDYEPPPQYEHHIKPPRKQRKLEEQQKREAAQQAQRERDAQEQQERWNRLRPEEQDVLLAQEQQRQEQQQQRLLQQQKEEELRQQQQQQQQQQEEGEEGQGLQGAGDEQQQGEHPGHVQPEGPVQHRSRLLPPSIAREIVRPRRPPSREGTPPRYQGKLNWTLEMEAAFLDYVKKYGRKWAKVEEAIDRTQNPLLMGLDKVRLNDKFKALKRSGRINPDDYPFEGEPEDYY